MFPVFGPLTDNKYETRPSFRAVNAESSVRDIFVSAILLRHLVGRWINISDLKVAVGGDVDSRSLPRQLGFLVEAKFATRSAGNEYQATPRGVSELNRIQALARKIAY